MPISHCLPNGQLGINELPVPNISGASITVFNPPGGVGARRGVVVNMHGLYTSAQQFPVPPSTAPGGALTDTYSTGISAVMANSHALNLAALGYVVLTVTAQEDTYAGNPMIGVYNDAASSTNGARYLASTLHTWDHVYQYIQQTYGYNSGTSTAWATSGGVPIFLAGWSIGSWRGLQILQNRTSQINGFFLHQPATYFDNVPAIYTPGATFATLNWSGLDVTNSYLSGIGSMPGMISYGTSDSAVGYGGSATLSGSFGSTITLSSTSGFLVPSATLGGQACYALLRDGSGNQLNFSYTGVSGSTLTGCTSVATFGTLSGTVNCYQSSIVPIINAAIGAGRNVVGNTTAEYHALSAGDAGFYNNSATTTTITTAGGNIPITSIQANFTTAPGGIFNGLNGTAGTVAFWNGTSWTTIPGACTVSGTNIAVAAYSGSTLSIPAYAPIVNTGTATAGSYTNVSIPYYVGSVINPSFPATG